MQDSTIYLAKEISIGFSYVLYTNRVNFIYILLEHCLIVLSHENDTNNLYF